MSNLKRFLALTIAVVMIVSGMAFNVSAKVTDFKPDTANPGLEAAIEFLAELGIAKGIALTANGFDFGGDFNVTREQFATFTARIRTANPNIFDYKSGDIIVPTAFADDADIDPAHKAAVEFCRLEGIVQGRENNMFDPKANVSLQEAVAMLARALGYTGLSWTGVLGESMNNKDIALLGTFAEFGLEGIRPGEAITRYQMAMLLYNYLDSNYRTVVYEINTPGSNTPYVGIELVPVLESFGIVEVVGYITSTPDWYIEMNVLDDTMKGKVALTGTSAVADPKAFRNAHDIVVSSYNVVKDSAGKDEVVKGVARLFKEDLGFKDKDFDDLLGRKISYYVDPRKNDVVRKVPAPKLLGEGKHEVDVALSASAFMTGDDAAFPATITLGTLPKAAATVYTQGKPAATYDVYYDSRGLVPEINIYAFDAGASIKATTAAENGVLLAKLAGSANNNFKLEYIDNGDGEFLYIVRPFKVGFYVRNHEGTIRLTTTANDNDGFNTEVATGGAKIMDNVKFATGETAENYFAIGNAYFYTLNNKKLDIYGKLVPETGAKATAIGSDRVQFNIPAAVTTDPDKIERPGFNPDLNLSAVSGILGAGLAVGGTYTLYRDPGTTKSILMAKQTVAADSGNSVYGVVQAISRAPLYVGNDLAYRVQVWDAKANVTKYMLVTHVNGVAVDGVDAGGALVSNTNVQLTKAKDFVRLDGDNKLVTYSNSTTGGFYNSAIEYVDQITLPSIGTVLSTVYKSGSIIRVGSKEAAMPLSSEVRILAYRAAKSATDPEDIRILTPAQLRELLDDTRGLVTEIILVGSGTSYGNALNVLVRTDEFVIPAVPPAGTYGVLLDYVGQDGTNFVYKLGEYNADGELKNDIRLVTAAGTGLTGSFVRALEEKVDTLFGEVHKITALTGFGDYLTGTVKGALTTASAALKLRLDNIVNKVAINDANGDVNNRIVRVIGEVIGYDSGSYVIIASGTNPGPDGRRYTLGGVKQYRFITYDKTGNGEILDVIDNRGITNDEFAKGFAAVPAVPADPGPPEVPAKPAIPAIPKLEGKLHAVLYIDVATGQVYGATFIYDGEYPPKA